MKKDIKILILVGTIIGIILLICNSFYDFFNLESLNKIIKISKFDSIGIQNVFHFILPLLCLLLGEIIVLGFRNSTLYRFLFKRSNSTKTDLLNYLFSLTGLFDFFGFIFSIGGFYLGSVLLYKLIGKHTILEGVNSDVFKIIIVFILSDLKHFLWHYFMHLNPFWELHKFHHSATEFNLITTARGHFFEKGFLSFFDSIFFY